MTPEEVVEGLLGMRLTDAMSDGVQSLVAGAILAERQACLEVFNAMLALQTHGSDSPEAEAARDCLDRHADRRDFAQAVSVGLYAVAEQAHEACAAELIRERGR